MGPATDKHQAPTHRLKLYVRVNVKPFLFQIVQKLTHLSAYNHVVFLSVYSQLYLTRLSKQVLPRCTFQFPSTKWPCRKTMYFRHFLSISLRNHFAVYNVRLTFAAYDIMLTFVAYDIMLTLPHMTL